MRQAAREASSNSPSFRQKSSRATSKRTTSQQLRGGSILYLEQNNANFNAPSKKESVFFDECNREVISLTSGFEQTNKTRVVFQKTDKKCRVEFLLPIEKRVLSIKLNPNWTVLAYHVERNIVELVNVREALDPGGKADYLLEGKRYVQSSRAKNSKLIGFLWTGPAELVIITDLSIEYYHLNASRCRLTLIKMFQSATNWFVFQPSVDDLSQLQDPYSVLMVSTGSLGNVMQPYKFQSGRVTRLQRFEVEGNWQDSVRLELIERSITIASIYGQVRLLVLQHESLNVKSKGAQIVAYTIDPDSGITAKTHTLDLDMNGRFAINILDNLVIAHDQPSKTSFIFDIMIKSTEKSDCPGHYVSLIDSQPIRALTLGSGKPVEMYSQNWVFFQPNFIVDAKLGILMTINLDLESLQTIVHDNNLLLSFLAHRAKSEFLIIKRCKQIVSDAYQQLTCDNEGQPQLSPLAEVSSAFEILGRLAVSAPQLSAGDKWSGPAATEESAPSARPCFDGEQAKALIYQEDVQREIFRGFDSEDLDDPARYHFISSAFLEFIFFVRRHEKNIEFCIYEQLLRCMLRAGKYFQIAQMIRSEIFKDSKQLACLLLSLKKEYRPAGQMGLDMFHRLPGGLPANLPVELVQEN